MKRETLQEYQRRVAAAGGRARAAKLTPERRSEIARIAAAAREAKKNAVQNLLEK